MTPGGTGNPVTTLLVVACLTLAAGVVGWPARPGRARPRRVLAGLRRPLHPAAPPSSRWERLRRLPAVTRPGPRELAAVVAALVGAATGLAGPVAGLLVAGYTGLAARGLHRYRLRQASAAARADLLEQLAVAAGNLRAGLPPVAALAVGRPGDGPADSSPSDLPPADAVAPLRERLAAAVRLAERTGAPLADVLERLEVDGRSADRARAATAGQVAGARATTWLLAGLPVGGIGLGYAIGADPLSVLLHTPVGAVCAVTAVGLQLVGLAWSARITRLDHHLSN